MCILFCGMINLRSQNSDCKINVLAGYDKNSILLRWVPNNPIGWKYLNQYGYLVEKYTLFKDSLFVENPLLTRIQLGIIKPWEMDYFENRLDTNDNLAIVAQALYGESFDVEVQSSIQSIINKAEELKSRYTFCMLAAAQSILAAEAAGLFIKDTLVHPGEKYVYRIIPLVPDTIIKIDTGIVYSGIDDTEVLPAPILLSVKEDEKKIIIKWDTRHIEKFYIYYNIERSLDSLHFKKINTFPYIPSRHSNDKSNDYGIFIDTLLDINKKYYYRIRGVNLFEQTGPPSNIMSVILTRRILSKPSISNVEIENNNVKIYWKLPPEDRSLIKEFKIYRGITIQSINQQINNEQISPWDSIFIDNSPQISNYYQIKAIDKYNNVSVSLPYFVPIEDSIPPSPPQGLNGNIDSSGNVLIYWSKNLESDILGYQVFRANYKEEEFLQVSSEFVKDTFFFEKIGINNLTSSLFYRLKAVDKHYNPSEFSSILSLRKPDIVPPQPPVITNYRISGGIVTLQFEKSYSDDVMKYLLYRRNYNDSLWLLKSTVNYNFEDTIIYDTCFNAPCKWQYSMIAIDSSGNESLPSNKLNVNILQSLDQLDLEIKNLYAIKNYGKNQIELYWQTNKESIGTISIFKSENNKELKRLNMISANINSYVDKNVVRGNNYEYYLIFNVKKDLKYKLSVVY